MREKGISVALGQLSMMKRFLENETANVLLAFEDDNHLEFDPIEMKKSVVSQFMSLPDDWDVWYVLL